MAHTNELKKEPNFIVIAYYFSLIVESWIILHIDFFFVRPKDKNYVWEEIYTPDLINLVRILINQYLLNFHFYLVFHY